MSDLITADEITHLKTSPRHLSWKDAVHGKGIRPPIIPTTLKSGYLVSYTIDSIFKDRNLKMEHVIVGAIGFTPDPADLDTIAHDIMGECSRPSPEFGSSSDGAHYLKIIGLSSTEEGRLYEKGIERGVKILRFLK